MRMREVFKAFFLLCLTRNGKSMASDQASATLPLQVSIWLSGFDGVINVSSELQSALPGILPFFSPLADKDIQYEVKYSVDMIEERFAKSYSEFILAQPLAAKQQDHRVVKVEKLAIFLRETFQGQGSIYHNRRLSSLFNIPVLVLDQSDLPKHYIIGDDEEACTQSFLGDIAFMDLSATFCDLLPEINLRVDGNIRSNSFVSPSNEQVPTKKVVGQVAGIIVSAIQVLATFNPLSPNIHAADRIFCPIVIIRNGGVFSNSSDEHQQHVVVPNIPLIESWMKSVLLPHQEIVLLTTTHFVDEHPQIAVALASSTGSYLSAVKTTTTSTTTYNNKNDTTTTSEATWTTGRIPFVDSSILTHELAAIGDVLCRQLLSRAGHGGVPVVSPLLRLEAASASWASGARADVLDWASDAKLSDDHSDVGADRTSVAMMPIFVISDLHLHHDRVTLRAGAAANVEGTVDDENKAKESGGGGGGDGGQGQATQPLFDRGHVVTVTERAALALHASSELVSTFSPASRAWRATNLSDLDALVAEGLTAAITGMAAPHAQLLQSRKLVDLTWTHGAHPFSPFGHLSHQGLGTTSAPEGGGGGGSGAGSGTGVLGWAARRGSIAARAHSAMGRALAVGRRSRALLEEVVDALLLLDGVMAPLVGMPPEANPSVSPEDEISAEAERENAGPSFHPDGIIAARTKDSKRLKGMPSELTAIMMRIEDGHIDTNERLKDLRRAVAEVASASSSSMLDPTSAVHKIVSALRAFEASLGAMERSLVDVEGALTMQLSDCQVEFDEDPMVSQRQTLDRMRGLGSDLHAMIWKRVMNGPMKYVILASGVAMVCLLSFGVKKAQEAMERKAKKLR